MKRDWTPEPWAVKHEEYVDGEIPDDMHPIVRAGTEYDTVLRAQAGRVYDEFDSEAPSIEWDRPGNPYRIVACVNALANVAHPDKLGELLAACHRAISVLGSGEPAAVYDVALEDINVALSAIGYEPPEKEEVRAPGEGGRMSASGSICKSCKWESPPEHPGRCYNVMVRIALSSASRPLQFIARSPTSARVAPKPSSLSPRRTNEPE